MAIEIEIAISNLIKIEIEIAIAIFAIGVMPCSLLSTLWILCSPWNTWETPLSIIYFYETTTSMVFQNAGWDATVDTNSIYFQSDNVSIYMLCSNSKSSLEIYASSNLSHRILSIDNLTFSSVNGRKMTKTQTNTGKQGAAVLFVCICATWR